jgi:hypothetical protein
MNPCQSQVLARNVFLPGRFIMLRLVLRGLKTPLSHKRIQANNLTIMLCLFIIAGVLAACGTAPTGQAASQVTPTPTAVSTLAPTPTATHTPKPTPTPTVQPAQPTSPPVVAAQPILDLRPSSMSIVGHLDCNKGQAFVCSARVLSRSDAQRPLNWFAFTNVSAHVAFSPAAGSLAPGQSVLVTITVPFNDCTPGLFFFRGPINSHTITWAC